MTLAHRVPEDHRYPSAEPTSCVKVSGGGGGGHHLCLSLSADIRAAGAVSQRSERLGWAVRLAGRRRAADRHQPVDRSGFLKVTFRQFSFQLPIPLKIFTYVNSLCVFMLSEGTAVRNCPMFIKNS